MATQIKAVILDRYYDLIAQSAIGVGNRFEIASFSFGFDLIDESGAEPVLLPIPSNKADISNKFFTSTPQLSYANGRTLIRCEMEKGTIPEGQTSKYSVCGIYDADGNLVIVLLGQVVWLTEADTHVVETYIDNALAGV